MTVKFGMVFKDGKMPDFGSIEKSGVKEFTLLEADKSKLNSVLTRAACTPHLADGSVFGVPSGANAVIADAPAVWRYHAQSDHWYEVIPYDE